MTCQRIADQKCPTCGAQAPTVEHTEIRRGGTWAGTNVVTQVDREIHCPGHLSIVRTVTTRLEKVNP